MKKRTGWIAAVLFLALASGGCLVKESTYLKKANEADSLSRELAALQQKHKELSDENAALKAKVAELSAGLEKTTVEREKLSADNRELENVLKAKSDSLSQTIMELRQRIGGLESENGRLKQEIVALQKAQEEKVQTVSKTYEDLLVKMKSEIAKGEVTISELQGKLTLKMVDAILFDSGKAEVKEEGQAVLQKVISILKDVKDKSIRTEGHTDNVPIVGMLAKRYPTNWELSAARAINVTRYLQEQGLDPMLLSAAAYGENRPVAANDTPEGKQKNRRIEIILVPKE